MTIYSEHRLHELCTDALVCTCMLELKDKSRTHWGQALSVIGNKMDSGGDSFCFN